MPISPAALDQATRAGVVELTRPNTRNVRCSNSGCRRLVVKGEGKRLWVDGHRRGFLCPACQKGVAP